MIYFYIPLAIIVLNFISCISLLFGKQKPSRWRFIVDAFLGFATNLSLLGLMYAIVDIYDENFREAFKALDMIMRSV